MPKKKPVDPIVSMVGRFSSTAQLLSAAVEKRGGNLAEALVLLARPAYTAELDKLADVLATARFMRSNSRPSARAPLGS